MTKIIGITGGIASGKSTAARMLQKPGVLLFNADQCVHQLLTKEKSCIALIKKELPKSYDEKSQTIIRGELAKIVSKDASALNKLEAILHPYVRMKEHMLIEMAVRNGLYAVILDIPLLFETGADDLCDATIAVDVAPDIQRRRAFSRPGMTEEKYDKLLARQLGAQARNMLADYVVTSNLGRANLYQQLQQIWHEVM